MPIRDTEYREHIEGPIVGVVLGGAAVVGLSVAAGIFWPVPVWAWVVGGLFGALFALLFCHDVYELATRKPKLIVGEAGIVDHRQPGGPVTLEWGDITDIRGEIPAEGERLQSVPITVETNAGTGVTETTVNIGGLEQPAERVFKAIRKAWRAAQKEGRATAPPDTEAAEQEALASAEIPTLVVRNYKGNPATVLGCGAVAAAVVFGVLLALDANEVRYICSGSVLFGRSSA